MLSHIGRTFRHVVTVEDGARMGGMGSAVREWMDDHALSPHILRLGLPDHFVEHGKVEQLHHLVGIDEEGIAGAIETCL